MNSTHLPLVEIQKIIFQKIDFVEGVYLFGSFSTNNATPQSDLDLAVLASKPISPIQSFEIAQEIVQHVRREVDLIDLRNANTVMQFQIVYKGIRFVTQSFAVCEAFEDFVFKSYARLNEERMDILNDISRRGKVSND